MAGYGSAEPCWKLASEAHLQGVNSAPSPASTWRCCNSRAFRGLRVKVPGVNDRASGFYRVTGCGHRVIGKSLF